jgi:hypothetical protein
LRVCYQKAKQQKQKGSMKAGGSFELFFPLVYWHNSSVSRFQISDLGWLPKRESAKKEVMVVQFFPD